jgi:hypothetical protein
MSSANPAVPNQPQSKGKLPVPPEEQFWQRYSPHYEFPLSSVTSAAIHILALIMLFLLGKYLFDKLNEQKKPLAEAGVVVVGGGGGNPLGQGDGPGGELKEPPPAPAEDVPDKPREENPVKQPDPNRPNLKPNVPLLERLPETKDDNMRQLLKEAGEAVVAQSRVKQDAWDKMRKGITGHGEGGPGSGGGRDRGKDTGKGSETGPGDSDIRVKRTLRWIMVFDTSSGEDYARQLAGLGAILAIPDDKGQYVVLRNLRERPAHGQIEDLDQIKRIYWVDDKRESITPLCKCLGVRVPDHVVAFFPEELEKLLLQRELRYKGRREDDIYETRFKVRKTGNGYEPVVIEQKGK